MIVKGPRDSDKAAEKLFKNAPTAGDALILHRLLVGLRRDRHPPNGEVEQSAIRMLLMIRPALSGVCYHKIKKRVPSVESQRLAKELLDEAMTTRGLTLVEALDRAYQKLA